MNSNPKFSVMNFGCRKISYNDHHHVILIIRLSTNTSLSCTVKTPNFKYLYNFLYWYMYSQHDTNIQLSFAQVTMHGGIGSEAAGT